MTRVFISAGDYSADLHGESLVREMRKLDPSLTVTSLGGSKLKGVSDHFLYDMVELDISGFTKPLKEFFRLKRILQETVFPRLKSREFDSIILIDYYDFNIFIAEKACEEGIPVYYFVSPQVWASRQGRIEKLKKYVTKMLVIFPFEQDLYSKHGVSAEFVGHPLLELVPEPVRPSQNGVFKLGLMPGSRRKELDRHLPLMLQSFRKLKKEIKNMDGVLFAVDYIPEEYYRSLVPDEDVRIVRDTGYALRAGMNLILTASGTATLENALLGVPMIVVYKTSWFTYIIAKNIIRVPYISMPNILSGSMIVPELIQGRANAEDLSTRALHYASHPEELERMRGELIKLRRSLGSPGAYLRTARIILGSS